MISFVLRNKRVSVSLTYLVLLTIAGLLSSRLVGDLPYRTNLEAKLMAPNFSHLFGTDYLGRDMLGRVVAGISYSYFPSVIILLAVMLVSLAIGITSAYYGKYADMALMCITDLFTAVPNLLLTIVLIGFLGFHVENLYLAIFLAFWARYVRMIRSLVLDIKKEPYYISSRVGGSFGIRTLVRYILPNLMPQVLTLLSLDVSRVILTLSGFSFLGIGAQPPSPEWGVMLLDGKNYMQIAPWVGIFPGIMVLSTALAFQLCGEKLRRHYELNG